MGGAAGLRWRRILAKGTIPAGTVRPDVVHVMDIAPTLLSLVESPPASKPRFDGSNVWYAFTGGARIPDRPICFPKDTIRFGKWKMSGGRLYDLETDLRETTNLAGRYPEEVKRLGTHLEYWQTAFDIKPGNPRANSK